MSNLSNKENRFKEILEDVSFDLDTSMLWDDIKDDLPVKKKKERRPIWYLLFGFFFTACVPALLLYSFSSTEASSTTAAVIPFNSIPVTQSSEDISQTDRAISNVISNRDEPQNFAVTSSVGQLEEVVKETGEVRLSSMANPRDHLIVNEDKTYLSDKELLVINNPLNDAIRNETIKSTTSSKVSLASIGALTAAIDIESVEIIENPLELVMVEPVTKTSTRFSPSLLFRSGINKSNVSNTVLSSTSEFDRDLFGYENALYGQSHYVGVALDNAKGWSWSFGMGYHTFNSSFRRSDVSTYEEQGQSVQGGSVTTTETTYHNINWHRRHKTYNLQLAVAKEILRYRNLSLSGELGVAYSLTAHNKGYHYLENSDTIEQFEQGDDSPYRSTYGVMIQPGLNINYNLNKLGIGLRGFYSNPINPITEDNNFYKTNNAWLGLQLQLAYRL